MTMKWLCSSSLSYNNFCAKTNTDDKIKHCNLHKNTETQEENIYNKENTQKATEINWDKSRIGSEH